MRFSRVAGLAGAGFVLVLLAANAVLIVAGFPPPASATDFGEIERIFSTEKGALRLASALLPLAWLLATLFAAGIFTMLWRGDHLRGEPWALVGAVGILMQTVAFTGVEASRLALAAAATHNPSAIPGLIGLYDGLFGFNQVFLATALLGLSISGRRSRVIHRWHAIIGLVGAVLLFISATTSPYGSDGAGNPLALFGLVGWLFWLVWILAYSSILFRRSDLSRSEGEGVGAGRGQ